MPDKIYKKGCGPGCLKCWTNKLKHASPEAKRYLKKNNMAAEWWVKEEQVTVHSNSNSIIKIEVAITDLIGVAKREIKAQYGKLHVENMHLYFKGVKLGDGRTLKHYGIEFNSILQLVYKDECGKQQYDVKLVPVI